MNGEDTITHFDLTNLLASGAFVRDGDRAYLFHGPFQSSAADKSSEISVCCPFFYETEKLSFLRPARVSAVPAMELRRALLRFVEEAGRPAFAPVWEEPVKADFEKAFARTQNLISEGQIDKAVPVVFARSRGTVDAALKARWMLELFAAPVDLHPYGWWDGDEGLIGATPELLFRVDGRSLKTMAVAGTLAKADGSAADLLRSSKDQHEHRLVIEDIRTQMSSFGEVRAGATEIAELPSLYHLRTGIEVDLNEDPEIEKILRRLHPTAALGVFPRLFGWRWMGELPGQEGRARFGAPVTFRLSGKSVLSLVAIRNLQWSGDRLSLGSGCGVVKDSELESEWRELARKRQSVLSLLGMPPAGTRS